MVALLIFYLCIVSINGDSDLQKFELHVKSLGDKLKLYAKNSLGTSYLQVYYIIFHICTCYRCKYID